MRLSSAVLALLTVLLLALLSPVTAAAQSGQPTAQSAPRAPIAGVPAARGPAETAARGPFDSAWMWVLERQRELTTAMTAAVRRLQGESFWVAAAQLGLISFLYGVFHAAGPGHGKFVISSYALANAETLRRGVLVSFMAAFLQAVSAIVLVGVLVMVVKATSLDIRRAEAMLETASWALIAGLGAWLLWTRLSPLLARRAVPAAGHAHVHHAHAHHDHGHAHAHAHSHAHTHAQGHHDHHHGHHQHHAPAHGAHAHHDHAGHHHHHHHQHGAEAACEACGHLHAPSPADLQGRWSWRQAWSIAAAVGIRPCTGAIAVLLFSLGIGLLAAGIFATFAMAIGTALTVSALAALAVTSRDLAARLTGAESRWAGRIQTAAGIAGSLAVLVLGTAFFIASLSGGGPL
ncbi:MAG: nickel/cobalt transporter [Hyphomicrobiaceae bacterium]